MRALYFLTAIQILSCSIVSAQENNLDPVVISASLSQERASATGRSLEIISSEQISKMRASSVDEILRYLPGVEVQSRGPFGSQSDIIIRGGNFQQVLVIIDGLRLNDPNTGHFNGNIPVAPSEIERIEILKGASSVIYGSEAVGGVINIITKEYAGGLKGHQLKARFTGGQHNLFGADAGYQINTERVRFSLGILSNNTRGQLQRGTRGSVYANTISSGLNIILKNNWQVYLRSAFDDRRFSAQNFYTNFLSDTANENISGWWHQAGLKKITGQHEILLQAGYKNLHDRYVFNPRSSANRSTSELAQVLLTDRIHLSKTSDLTTGLQWNRKAIHSNDRGDHHVQQLAGFLLWNQKLGHYFTIHPGVRLEYNTLSKWELVPQGSIGFKKGNLQLRANAGKTIRDADFTERFNNYQKALVTGGRIGNPDLLAERSFSYEAGADYMAGKYIKVSLTGFSRNQERLIDYVVTPYSEMPRKSNLSPTGTYALAKNLAAVRIRGIDGSIGYLKNFTESNSLQISSGIVLLATKQTKGVSSLYLNSNAKTLITWNAFYQSKRFTFNLNGLYKARPAQPGTIQILAVEKDYAVVNLEGSVMLTSNIGLFAGVNNLFDKTYADLLGARMPGRWLLGGIKFSFNKNNSNETRSQTPGN